MDKNKFVRSALKTGYKRLDDAIGGGLFDGGLCFITGDTGSGKTNLAMNIALRVAKRGHRVLFTTFEVNRAQFIGKAIAMEMGNVSATDVWSGRIGKEDFGRFAIANDNVKKRPICINDNPHSTVQYIRNVADEFGAKLIIIDYFGMLVSDGGNTDRFSDRYSEILKCGNELKTMAADLGVPVVCVVHGKKNGMRNIAGLGDYEPLSMFADVIIGMHPFEQEPWQTDETGLDVVILKNREGKTGVFIDMLWHLVSGKITEVVKGDNDG